MVRTREGWEIIQIALPCELVTHVRVRAAMTRRTNGDILNELAQVGVKAQGGLVDQVKEAPAPAPRAERKKAQPVPTGKGWDQGRLVKAMERAELSGRGLAEQLESSRGTAPSGVQVNRWTRGAELIPAHYWPQLDSIFGGAK